MSKLTVELSVQLIDKFDGMYNTQCLNTLLSLIFDFPTTTNNFFLVEEKILFSAASKTL